MKMGIYRAIAAASIIAVLPLSAQAQFSDMLKQGSSGSTSGIGSLGSGGLSGGGLSGGALSGGGLGGALSGQSMTSGSTGNVAGVLQFCIKNNYLSGGGASSVKESLMSKLGGGTAASSDTSYTDGSRGILDSGGGKQVDLSGGGLKQQITKKVCDKILAQGKSML